MGDFKAIEVAQPPVPHNSTKIVYAHLVKAQLSQIGHHHLEIERSTHSGDFCVVARSRKCLDERISSKGENCAEMR